MRVSNNTVSQTPRFTSLLIIAQLFLRRSCVELCLDLVVHEIVL